MDPFDNSLFVLDNENDDEFGDEQSNLNSVG